MKLQQKKSKGKIMFEVMQYIPQWDEHVVVMKTPSWEMAKAKVVRNLHKGIRSHIRGG